MVSVTRIIQLILSATYPDERLAAVSATGLYWLVILAGTYLFGLFIAHIFGANRYAFDTVFSSIALFLLLTDTFGAKFKEV